MNRASPHREENDYFSTLIGRMSSGNQDLVAKMSKVKSEYVVFGRDKLIRETFDRFLVDIMSKKVGGDRSSGQAFFVVGESGAGKSEAVQRLIKEHPVLRPISSSYGSRSPYVSISLQGPGTLKTLGMAILRKAGYESERDIDQGVLWARLPNDLKSYGVFLVHIDETQHMLKQSESGWQSLANALKGMMNNTAWPVSFLLSGMPETTRLIAKDDQMERRQYVIDCPALSLPDERILVEKILRQLCGVAGLDCQVALHSDLPERIAHAANYQFGRVTQVTYQGILQALTKGATVLDREHFALAALDHSAARGLDVVNPFLVDAWENLKPGWFVPEEGLEAA